MFTFRAVSAAGLHCRRMAGKHRDDAQALALTDHAATRVRAFAAALLLLSSALLRAADAPTPAGLWQQIDDHSGKVRTLVQIDETAGVLRGRIEKLFPNLGEDPSPRCVKCSGARKDQPVVGLVFLTGLKRESDSSLVWTDGEILDPESGSVYRSKVTLSPDGQTLNVRGYIGISLIGRSQTWKRAP